MESYLDRKEKPYSKYINWPSCDSTDWMWRYWGQNYNRLLNIKAISLLLLSQSMLKILITDRWIGCGQGSQSHFQTFSNIVKTFAKLRWQLYCVGVLGPRERVPALPERGQPGQRLLPLHPRQTPGPPTPALATHRAIIIYFIFIYYVGNIIVIAVTRNCGKLFVPSDLYGNLHIFP